MGTSAGLFSFLMYIDIKKQITTMIIVHIKLTSEKPYKKRSRNQEEHIINLKTCIFHNLHHRYDGLIAKEPQIVEINHSNLGKSLAVFKTCTTGAAYRDYPDLT